MADNSIVNRKNIITFKNPLYFSKFKSSFFKKYLTIAVNVANVIKTLAPAIEIQDSKAKPPRKK